MKWVNMSLGLLILSSFLSGCQAVQEQTNKEAPNQIQQKEGRQEIKKSGEEKDKEKSGNKSPTN